MATRWTESTIVVVKADETIKPIHKSEGWYIHKNILFIRPIILKQ